MPSTNEYMRTYMTARRERRRCELAAMLGDICARCGTTEGLDFDHIDPKTKLFTIADGLDRNMAVLVAEAQKCQLLCRPCHREKSRESGDPNGGGHNRINNPGHGTQVMYAREKCRCEICRQWRRRYRRGEVDAQGNPPNAGVAHVGPSAPLS